MRVHGIRSLPPHAIAALAASALFFPTVFFDWIYFDDYLIVSSFDYYSRLGNIVTAFFRTGWDGTAVPFPYYRPVATAVNILGAWTSKIIAGQALPAVYHVTNVVFHATNAALVVELGILLRLKKPAALALALLFAVLPIATGAVCWIPGANELLLALLALAALVFLLLSVRASGKRAALFGVAHGAALLGALLTKENAIVIPLLGALLLHFEKKGEGARDLRRFAAVWLGVAGAAFAMRAYVTAGHTQLTFAQVLLSLWNGLKFLPIYAGKVLFPWDLSVLPIYRHSPLWPGTVAVLVLSTALYASAKKDRNRILLGTVWFLGFLMPTFLQADANSGNFILREDRAYLASIGLLLVLFEVDALKEFAWKPSGRRWAAVAVLASFAAITLSYATAYGNGQSFYSAGAKSSPSLAFAHTHLGDMHLAQQDFPKALESYSRALELNPSEPMLHNNIGVLYLRQGKLKEAELEFLNEIGIQSKNALAWHNLGLVHARTGDLAKAELAWREAVSVDPRYLDSWKALAGLYSSKKEEAKFQEAAAKLRAFGVLE